MKSLISDRLLIFFSIRFQVLRRHIIPHEVVSLEDMSVDFPGKFYNADNGDEIIVRKVTENGNFLGNSKTSIHLSYFRTLNVIFVRLL